MKPRIFSAMFFIGWIAACAGCTGHSSDSAGRGSGGNAGLTDVPDAAAAGGGHASGGATAGSGNTGGDCSGDTPTCIRSCDSNAWEYAEVTCVDGAWHCPPGKFDNSTCSPNSAGACVGTPYQDCIKSCSTGEYAETQCINRTLQCPAGTVERHACPLDSCARARWARCCFTNGTVTTPGCDDNGKLTPCPEGSKLTEDQCFPEGVSVQSCSELDGRTCASEDSVCDMGCVSKCSCKRDTSGKMVWSCASSNCFP